MKHPEEFGAWHPDAGNSFRQLAGFTLIELIVALGVLSIIIGYATVSVRDAFARTSLTAEGMSTRALFVDCKLQATGGDVESMAVVERNDKRIDALLGDSSSKSTTFTPYRSHNIIKAIDIEKTTFSGRNNKDNEVFFNPDGSVEGVNGAVYYILREHKVRVLVDAVNGNVSVQRYLKGKWR